MDILTAVITVITVISAHAGALLALWLRLRWQVRHARIQGRYLVRLVQMVAGHGQLEWGEEHGKAHRLTMTLTYAPRADTAP
ncbi:hypothetical protein BKM31_55540 [[Actinomadura] parvosata subsp. kistnae]|uniref:Uncharacterized protein n=1 Tax=[Actinomadura] parvosata subsp. kistnae TaxID=1909395 RepID=A0A1V0AGY2_9ACTN|nr:hypothetical protein [Nonomuraea sp. ATCC 55076]AQZ69477.1 hypothetical protein BKM31_55540 [Nonomuraea sp. ATCC 55076]